MTACEEICNEVGFGPVFDVGEYRFGAARQRCWHDCTDTHLCVAEADNDLYPGVRHLNVNSPSRFRSK